MTAKAIHGARSALFIGFPLALAVAGTLPGQQVPGIPQTRLHAPPGAERQEVPTLSVEFHGGTVEEYIKVLSKAAPNLNVVIRPETKDVPMPPVSLKAVSQGTALQLIPALADSSSEIAVNPVFERPGEGSQVFVIGTQAPTRWPAQAVGVQPGGIPGVPSVRMMHSAMSAPGPPVKSVRVFSLRALTSGPDSLKPETVLTAIDTALGLQGGEEAASIKLHAESGLLVVHGDPAQIDAVAQVLTTMEEDTRSRVNMQQQALVNENANLKQKVERLEKKIADLEDRVLKTQSDFGQEKK